MGGFKNKQEREMYIDPTLGPKITRHADARRVERTHMTREELLREKTHRYIISPTNKDRIVTVLPAKKNEKSREFLKCEESMYRRNIWTALENDDDKALARIITNDKALHAATTRMWNPDKPAGIKSKSLVDVCCTNVRGVPERGAVRCLYMLLQCFPECISIFNCANILMRTAVHREMIRRRLLLLFNSLYIEMRGEARVKGVWHLATDAKSTLCSKGFYVCTMCGWKWFVRKRVGDEIECAKKCGNIAKPMLILY